MIAASELMDCLKECPQGSTLHFESGTLNFTVNSVYTDECGCLCRRRRLMRFAKCFCISTDEQYYP